MNRPIAAFLALLLATTSALATGDAPSFLRLVQGADGKTTALEVAISRFRNADGVTVDLVGAVHVADRAYFQRVDARLARYDVVLYELVGEPDDLLAPPPDAAPSMVALFQGGMKDALGLSWQLDEIDYARANMIHADLSGDEFAASMEARGESVFQLILRAWALGHTEAGMRASLRSQKDLFDVLFASDRQLALKRMVAGQLADEQLMRLMLSDRDGSTLIEVRNARALERLAEQLETDARKIAIFYGAGHMADFARRLADDFRFVHTDTEWVTAWDLGGG